MLSLQQAAKAVGKSKPTLSRAIKGGRLSATRTATGAYEIDPAELARVFPVPGDMTGTVKQREPGNGAGADPAADLPRPVMTASEPSGRGPRISLWPGPTRH